MSSNIWKKRTQNQKSANMQWFMCLHVLAFSIWKKTKEMQKQQKHKQEKHAT